ncbi:MAG TPA: methyltransferase [Mucilaginibacter sp.]|nr:methyltransferase [Mucilaginibacter sp.]
MTQKEEAYNEIAALIERFSEQFDSYKKAEYNETLTRRDFIDPFFKALGWDIDNHNGYAEAYREVIHEDKVKVGSATKAPDYSFRLVGGKRLFFVEAKKPSVVVKDDIVAAYQVRRYGWSAKLSISIITDFEEFSIYDCTKKPIPTDKASVARVKYITYKDYLKEFDFIWNTFSKERVLQGSFDKFIIGTANKKGTATVDKEFLQSLDSWRTQLATSISWNNKDLDEDEINFAVQQTIDRIIFLRIAEDRSVEPYGNLKIALKQGDYYQNLFSIFKEADDKYNSGLFNFKKDQISKNLKVDNKAIKAIITELYYPVSPYEFSVLSVEILGYAYEQFLGKVIRITPAHHVKIEEKPQVRKAGGVYYTPQYIVEYIVKNTVGKLVDGKTPKEISKIKIVDPACGSGSFLIGAYQYLLDFHKNYYTGNGKISKGTKGNTLTPEGNLTTAEKKRILINNIFGVDIDVNAVEVTKLSLLLKCMEGETSASIAHQLSIFHERVLPTLDENIKDGNSLIDTDYYDAQLDFGDERKIKPFSWKNTFPEIFKQQGFDVVIGNPPYLKERGSKEIFEPILKSRIGKLYHQGKMDFWYYFVHRGIDILKSNGYLGFITNSYWMKSDGSSKLIKRISTELIIDTIVDFDNYKVFEDVSGKHNISIYIKGHDSNQNCKVLTINKGNPSSNIETYKTEMYQE